MTKSKDSVTKSKDRVTKSKDRVTKSKDRVTKSEDRVTKSKDKVTKSKDKVTKSKDRVTKPKLRCFWGRKTEGQGGFGVDLGSLWGDPGETLGGQGGRGRAPAAEHFFSWGLKL